MLTPTITRKQISVYVRLDDWLVLRLAAARQNVSITTLLKRCMEPEIARLRSET